MHPDRMVDRVKEFGTKDLVIRAEHKHRDISRLLHDELGLYGEKLKALASIMVGLEHDALQKCGIVSFRDCSDRLEQVEVRYKHTEVDPLYHRIALDFAFLEGTNGERFRITDLPMYSDWFEVDIYELEDALTAAARLWLDRNGITSPITSANVVYF